MRTVDIKLSFIDDVKEFVGYATDMECDIDLVSGRYIVDAKSIIGIFSLDFKKPIRVDIYGTDNEYEEFLGKIDKFLIK